MASGVQGTVAAIYASRIHASCRNGVDLQYFSCSAEKQCTVCVGLAWIAATVQVTTCLSRNHFNGRHGCCHLFHLLLCDRFAFDSAGGLGETDCGNRAGSLLGICVLQLLQCQARLLPSVSPSLVLFGFDSAGGLGKTDCGNRAGSLFGICVLAISFSRRGWLFVHFSSRW